MKKCLTFLFLICGILQVSGQTGKKITILFTNDLHSRVTGYAPEASYTPMSTNDDNTIGGFARIASIISSEKQKNTGPTLVLDAGDFLMGTLFQSLEPETGFQLVLMKMMGYDAVCFGNHEFDFGPEKLGSIISSAVKNGPVPSMLLSNVVFDKKDAKDDSLEKLFNDNVIERKVIIERDGLKIGLFSIMGKVADDNAAFAKPVTFSKQVSAAKRISRELKDEKCDIVICLSHSGVTQLADGSWGGEDVELAGKVKDIDVIISGHTHTRLDEAIIIKGIPVVQTGEYGQFVGKLSLDYNSGKLNVDGYSLIKVDDKIPGDASVQAIIEKQKKRVNLEVLVPSGMDYTSPLAESDFLLDCNEHGDFQNSNLGPMVADAIYKYVNNHVESGTDICMVAVGVIRDRIVPGVQTAPDIFRLMSMGSGNDNVPGYPLATLYVTGKELKSILEILQVAYRKAPENYCFYSGLHVFMDPSKGLLKKIQKIDIIDPEGQTRTVNFSKKDKTLYSITANSYMMEFIGIIKKMSFGLINVVPKNAEGLPVKDMKTAVIDIDKNSPGIQEGKEWLAIAELLRVMKDTNGNGIPDIDRKYSKPAKTFTEIK
jgi:5'-nucleotidase